MRVSGRGKGLIIFGLIVVVVIVAALAAFRMTGYMGIEDRFSTAVGLPVGGEEGDGTLFGFSVEGNPVLYIVVLGILLTACFLLYRRFMATTD